MINEIKQEVRQRAELLQELSDGVWQAAEVAGEETVSARLLANALRDAGFTVEEGLGSQPTAFRATYGDSGPKIGFIAEYDALPDLRQAVKPFQTGSDGGPGHGCGHNLLGAGSTVAAIALASVLRQKGLPGRVILYGTPSEETMFGKGQLLKEGFLGDVDVMLAWHPQTRMRCGGVMHNAMNSILFSFYGRTAHAAADPQNGRSALDAAELMNVGCNYLREHIAEGSRLHYVYTHSGEKPNIVPSYAQVWYFVRARTRAALDEITQRVIQVAQGAAQMTDTRVESSFLVKGTHTLVNDRLSQLAFSCAQHLEAPHFSEDCVRFAEELHREIPQIEPQFDTHIPCPVAGTVEYETGSTDLSLVSHAVPTIELCVTCFAKNTPGHHWAITAQAGGEMGQCGTMFAAQWLALMGGRLVEDPCLLKQVQAEFQKRIADEEE